MFDIKLGSRSRSGHKRSRCIKHKYQRCGTCFVGYFTRRIQWWMQYLRSDFIVTIMHLNGKRYRVELTICRLKWPSRLNIRFQDSQVVREVVKPRSMPSKTKLCKLSCHRKKSCLIFQWVLWDLYHIWPCAPHSYPTLILFEIRIINSKTAAGIQLSAADSQGISGWRRWVYVCK